MSRKIKDGFIIGMFLYFFVIIALAITWAWDDGKDSLLFKLWIGLVVWYGISHFTGCWKDKVKGK